MKTLKNCILGNLKIYKQVYLKRTMIKNNTYKILRIFNISGNNNKPEFKIINEPHQTEGMPLKKFYFPEINAEEISKFYKLPLGSWHSEKIANLINPRDITKSEKALELNWITPLDVKAHRKGVIKINPLVACSIAITKDNQILIPFRGGELTEEGKTIYARGKVGLIPGGSITWKQEYIKNPIEDTIAQEFIDELGQFNYKNLGLICILESISDLPGIKFVSLLKINASLKQIQGLNNRSIELRNLLIKQELKPEEIEKELKNKNLPIGAWENSPILGIENNSFSIKRILEAHPEIFTAQALGALSTYTQSLSQ